MGALYAVEILAIVSFVLASVICYAVVLVMNAGRDVDHQVPILKSFLYALAWTPAIFFGIYCILSIFVD
jgi:hypothetical protein